MKSTSIPHAIVAVRAHLIWRDAGRPDGQSHQHWIQAERELENEAMLQRAFNAEEGRVPAGLAVVPVEEAVAV